MIFKLNKKISPTEKALEDTLQKRLYEEELKKYNFMLEESLYDVEGDIIHNLEIAKCIDTICSMIRNELVWSRAVNRFGENNSGNAPILYLKNITTPYKNQLMNLHDKLFLVDVWMPYKYLSRHIIEYALDFISNKSTYTYYYYKNLQIGYVGSSGNHRMLLQMIQNKNIDAYVNIIDDTEWINKYYTDGKYINDENGNAVLVIDDYRMAILFTLTKRKMELLNKTNDKM